MFFERLYFLMSFRHLPFLRPTVLPANERLEVPRGRDVASMAKVAFITRLAPLRVRSVATLPLALA
jgi:hypothetical protein